MESEMLYQKQGFSPNDVGAVLTLIVGVAVATLVLIFTGALGGQTYNLVEADINEIGNQSQTAVSFVANSSSGTYLGYSDIHAASLKVYNSSGSSFATGFTLDATSGVVTSNATWNGQTFLANFSWGDLTAQQYVKDAIASGFKAQKTTGTYLPLIVLAAVIGIVLTMVLGLGSVGQRPGFGSAL